MGLLSVFLPQSNQLNVVQSIKAHQEMITQRNKNNKQQKRVVKMRLEDEEFYDEFGEDDTDFEAEFGDESGSESGEQDYEFVEATPNNYKRYMPPANVMNSRKQKDPFSTGSRSTLGNPFAKQPPKNNPFSKKQMTFGAKPTFGGGNSICGGGGNSIGGSSALNSKPKNNPFAKQKKAFAVTRHDVSACLRYGQNGSQPRNSSIAKVGNTMGRDADRFGEVLPPKVTRGMLAVQRDAATVLKFKGGSKGFGKVREDLGEVRETLNRAEDRQPWHKHGGKKKKSMSVYYE